MPVIEGGQVLRGGQDFGGVLGGQVLYGGQELEPEQGGRTQPDSEAVEMSVGPFRRSGAPPNGWYNGVADKGATAVDITTGDTYRNTGTKAATVWTVDAPSGGGSTPALAAVLAEGNDAAGQNLVCTKSGNDEAVLHVIATSADGGASFRGDATATGEGNAEALANAVSLDGTASADRTATSTNWSAHADTQVAAGGSTGARASTGVIGNGGASARAELYASVETSGGVARTNLQAFRDSGNDAGVGIRLEANGAGGYKFFLDGLDTSDPVEAGRLWLDGTTLKISAG